MDLTGKGCFIWKIQNCEGGDPDAIAKVAREAGMTHILLKIADGAYSYNYDREKEYDLAKALVQLVSGATVEREHARRASESSPNRGKQLSGCET